ncbi:MAG: ABC transporter permease [Thermoflexales bacterium]|nr:ABC transporter permease [Thermoflexales bacterium]
MIGTRWRKVWADVWGNKTRTLLVVLSVAAGVFAVGAMAHMNLLARRDLLASYEAIKPAHATISLATDNLLSTFAAFDDGLVETVRKVEGVAEAEGRRTFPVRFRHTPQDNWNVLMLVAVPDYNAIRINLIKPEVAYSLAPGRWPAGAWPPPEREVVLERSGLLIPFMGLSKTRLGDTITVQAPDGSQRQVRLAGLAYDFGREAATTAGMPSAYVTPETLEWLGGPPGYSELNIRVMGDARDKAHIERVARRVRDQMQAAGYIIGYTSVPTSGRLPADNTFQAISLVLSVIGVLSLFLGVLLVINTISAILAQQTRQIGVMKAVGAGRGQIIRMYLGLVMIFGLLGWAIAVPLAAAGARGFIGFLAYFVNFKAGAFRIPPEVILLEAAVALLVPVIAALGPIFNGTRLTVREALGSYGLGQERSGGGWLDKLLAGGITWLPSSRPLLLSLRNTFRRKGRLALTLLTLSLACAVFISVMSARTSAYLMVDDMIRYWNFDVEAFFTGDYRLDKLFAEVERIPGVTHVENLSLDTAYRIRPDGSESKPLRVIAAAPATQVLDPVIIAGRWLVPGDENAVLLNARVLKDEPDIHLGSPIRLKIQGHEGDWHVVGIYQVMSVWKTDVHASYDYYSRVVNQTKRASGIAVKTQDHDEQTQLDTTRAMEDRFKEAGIGISLTYTTAMLRTLARAIADAVIVLLSTMAALVATVGGLGLMGTMSINVLERTREIGVMRAIGASDAAVRWIVIAEGIFTGLISWVIGVALAVPLGKWFSDGLGIGFMGSPFPYEFSVQGALWCLLGVIVIAAAASAWPAWNASRLTVREVLAYG